MEEFRYQIGHGVGTFDPHVLLFTEIRNHVPFSSSIQIRPEELNEGIEEIAVFREGTEEKRGNHVFVVCKTKKYFYSVERWDTSIFMQRSSKLVDVVNIQAHLKDFKRRKKWIIETNWVKGKGTVENLVDFVTTKA